MWFFPQIELNKEHSLFVKIIIISLFVHAIFVIGMFLGDAFFAAQSLVLGKSGGAQVSMARGGSRKASGSAPLPPVPVQQEAAKQEERVEPLPTVQKKSEPIVAHEKKAEVRQKPIPENKEKVPAFSPLKKKYTSLKKKEAKAPTPSVEKPVNEQSALAQSDKKKEVDTKKVINKEPEKKREVVQQQKRESLEPQGNGLEQGGGSMSGSYSAERLEFAVDEPAGSDSVIVQEIERHYHRPPGFDDHESFVFTFEIKNGKATAISPKGHEPLVIYSAVKEAVLKSTFPISKQQKKIELIIKSNS